MISSKDIESSLRTTSKKVKEDYFLSYEDKFTIMEALDHYYVTKQYQDIGLCTLCKKICFQKCSICGAHYCNSNCQNNDWPRHKLVCTKHSDSGSDTASAKSVSLSKTNETNCGYSNENYLLNSSNASPFKTLLNYSNKKKKDWFSDENEKGTKTFPPNNSDSRKKESGNKRLSYNNNKNENKRPPCTHSRTIENISSDANKAVNQKPQSLDKNKKEDIIKTKKNEQRTGEQLEKPTHAIEVKRKEKDVRSCFEPLKAIENFGYVKTRAFPSLTTKEPKDVVCTYRESQNRHWVMDSNDMSKFAEIQMTLAKSNQDFEEITPRVGLLCAATYGDEWYRGEVISISPKLVHFIDYGNTEVCNSELKKLPESLESMPRLAYLIEFESGTPNEYNFENLETLNMKIKETRKESDGVSCVEVVEGYFGPTQSPPKNQQTDEGKKSCRSIVDCLSEKCTGVVFLNEHDGWRGYGSVIPDENSEASSCLEQIFEYNYSNTEAIEGAEGDYVLVSDESGQIQRGKIISKIGCIYYVVLIDSGPIVATEKVYSLPAKGRQLIHVGGMLTLKHDTSEVLDVINFEITGESENGKWPCVLKLPTGKKRNLGDGFLEKPPETVELSSTQIYLKNKCSVVLTAVSSTNSVYVRPLDQSVDNKLLDINTAINENAGKLKSYTSPPPVGKLCCAKFEEDGFYYRGKVIKIANDKVTVLFVDFGNVQHTDLAHVKHICTSLEKIPFLAGKIKLKDVSPDSMSPASLAYLNQLLKNETPLIINYEVSIKEGVVLTEKESGNVVNDRLINEDKEKEKEKPAPTQCDESSDGILTAKNLKYIKLNSESICNLCVLHVNEKEMKEDHSFWATEDNNPNLVFVFGDMNTDITAYCNQNTQPWKPRVGEVCLAQFEGAWYRALAVKQLKDENVQVLFLDFGNSEEVNSKSIRKMDEKFLTAPVLAISCCIEHDGKLSDEPGAFEKVYNFLQASINSTFEGVRAREMNENRYSVSVPEIAAILNG